MESNVMLDLMENSQYWESVDIMEMSEGIKVVNKEVESTKDSNNDEWDMYDLWDEIHQSRLEDMTIIEESIKLHSEKRFNRKYIANSNRKHKIKDKKKLFFKATPDYYADQKQKGQELIDKKVAEFPTLRVIKHEKIGSKRKEMNPVLARFYSWSRYFDKTTGSYIPAYGYEYVRVVYLSESNIFPWRKEKVLVDYFNQDIEYRIKDLDLNDPNQFLILSEMKHLDPVVKESTEKELRPRHDYEVEQALFYGKPVNCAFFCNGIYLLSGHHKDFYHLTDYQVDRKRWKSDLEYSDPEIFDIDYVKDTFCSFEDFDNEEDLLNEMNYDGLDYGFNIKPFEYPEDYWDTEVLSMYKEPLEKEEEFYDPYDYYDYMDFV
jgi:hypothetical protein